MNSRQTNIEKEFRENHFPALRAYFEKIIRSQFEVVQAIADELLPLAVEGKSVQIFKKIISSVNRSSALFNLSETQGIHDIMEKLPEKIVVPLEDAHINWEAGDSLVVKMAKSGKKLRQVLGNKNQEREVGYRYLIGCRFVEYYYLNLLWQKSLFGWYANILVELKVLALKMYSNNASEGELETIVKAQHNLLLEFTSKLNAQIQVHLDKFAEQLSADFLIAGTIELPNKTVNKEMFERKANGFSMDAKESARIWGDLINVNVEQLDAAATLNELNSQLNEYEESLQKKFQSKLSSQIHPSFSSLYKHLEEKLSLLEKSSNITSTKLEEVCEEIKATTLKEVQEIVTPLEATSDEMVLSKYLEDFASKVSLLANQVQQKITLVDELKYNEQLPEYLLKPIQWQSLFRRILGDEYLSELLAEDIKPEQKLQLIIEDFSETEQIITTNLTIAQDVEKSEDEEPYEIVKKGLELALMKLDEIGEDFPKIEQFLESELDKHQQELSDRISKLLIDQDAGQIKREDAKIKVRQSASDVREKLGIYWAKFVDKLEIGRRFIFSKFRTANDSIRSFLGMIETEHINVQKTNIAALLHDVDQKYRQLPYIYRRLFDFKRPADQSFFVKHHPHFETATKAYELWKSDFPSSIAILGEKGSGRTTELNYLRTEVFVNDRVEMIDFKRTVHKEKDLLEELCKQLKISQKKSGEEIVALLSRRRKKTVIVVENLQNCFLRTVNGYEAINTLLYLISETKDKVLWVCSCSKYAWNFLNVAVKIGDYFSHSVMIDNQPAANIAEIISRRQVASGYQLEIIPDDSTKSSRAFKKLLDDDEKRHEYLQKVLFERLNKMAEGNATVAMIYWIRCIQKIESAQIQIELLEGTGIEYLSELDSQTLFVLAAFVLHDVLGAEQLAECLNFSPKNAETIISRLCSRGLLVELKHGYGLNDLIYRQVVRLLTSRNLINA